MYQYIIDNKIKDLIQRKTNGYQLGILIWCLELIRVIEDTASKVFLRPETAQGIFFNFKNIQRTTRKKLPFGVAK